MINIVVTGFKGRMGQRLAALIDAAPDLALAAGVDAGDRLEDVISRADVVVDFSAAAVAGHHAAVAAEARRPIVIGTTGLDATQEAAVREAARAIPVVAAPNMAIGVNVLWKVIDVAARALGELAAIDIEETHHVHKLDRPSGTAKRMLEIVQRACPSMAARGVVSLSDDAPWARTDADRRVSLRTIRRDEVVGDHAITFRCAGESFTLMHHAESRDIFVEGALAAARWIIAKPPGLYGMDNVLGL
jgi:4-hydroxy-tetrahydrodipicolinate reductase